MSLDTQTSVNYYDKHDFYFKLDENGAVVEFEPEPFSLFPNEIQRLHSEGYLSVDDMQIHCTENTSYGPSNYYGEQDTEKRIYFSSINANYSHNTLEGIVTDVLETLTAKMAERNQGREEEKELYGDAFPRPYYGGLTPPVNPSNAEEVALYEGRAPIGSEAYIPYHAPGNKIQFTKMVINSYSPVSGEYFYTTVGYGYYSDYSKKFEARDRDDKQDSRAFITTEVMERLKATAVAEGRFYDPQNHNA